MKTPMLTPGPLAAATILLVTAGTHPASAQTMDEALTAYFRNDHATALAGFRIYAEQGNAEAQNILGVMYEDGKGIPEDDAEAVRWYRLAAEQGHAGAQLNLGFMYARGEGVPKDDAEAVRWYRLAAEQGHAGAQTILGTRYAHGDGVPEDDAEAYAWYSIAAAQGHEIARNRKERLSRQMTRARIDRAQELSREYWERYVVPFR